MKTALHRFFLAALLAAAITSSHAQNSMVPSAMSYQGFLTDAQGDPVAPTTPENRNVEFRIYSVAAGGVALWGEAQTATVFKGNFSVILGNGTALSGIPSGTAAFTSVFTNATTADLYFGISPQGGAEFAPRQKLLASAFALRAKTAEAVNASAQANGVASQFNWLAANNLAINGHGKVTGNNVLEFGFGVPNKEGSAGMIGYDVFGASGLSIVGGGETGASRKLNLFAEGGTTMTGPLFFGNRVGQHINLFNDTSAIGVQGGVTYFRESEGNFFFYKGGTHSDIGGNPGNGGVTLAEMRPSGFALLQGRFSGDGSGLTNLPAPSFVNNLALYGTITRHGHGPYIATPAGEHALGSQDWTTYMRTPRHFSWYLGGNHDNAELSAGGGSRLMTLNAGGLNVGQGALTMENGPLHFGSRLGQHINLFGTTNGLGIQSGRLYQRATGFSWFVGGSHSDAEQDAGGGVKLADWSLSRIDFNRRVYITASPTDGLAPLEVNGSSGVPVGGARHYHVSGQNQFGPGENLVVSIRANTSIVAASFVANSDIRMKLPEGRSDAARDLATLGALEVTDYTMKDKTVDRGRAHKKLIAQQVEKVYPQAVSKTHGVVPDIFRIASAKDGLITFKEAGETTLKKGETVRLVRDDGEIVSEVTAVKREGFTVKDAVKDGEVFVYGRRVNDLRGVDYEAIAMLNVSATQELTRQLRAQTTANEKLSAENIALQKQVAALKAGAARQDERLAAIETLLKSGSRPVTQQTNAKTAAR